MLESLREWFALVPGNLSGEVVQYIQAQFGTPGLVAAGILGLTVAAVLVIKLVKIAFDILRFVAVPSLVVTFVASWFLPYPFATILPVAVMFFSVVLIFRG